ncbi:hypothetical protein FQR65_LT12983 [Abscondita terminalis]|nr:hypothetical protein FQR65_LT12983 [Abscondita terminalis]
MEISLELEVGREHRERVVTVQTSLHNNGCGVARGNVDEILLLPTHAYENYSNWNSVVCSIPNQKASWYFPTKSENIACERMREKSNACSEREGASELAETFFEKNFFLKYDPVTKSESSGVSIRRTQLKPYVNCC